MSSFWDTVWLILMTFVLVAYLIVLFQIIVDLFRDKNLGGFSKAIWFIGLVFLPFLTALLYIIFRGRGMSERQVAAVPNGRPMNRRRQSHATAMHRATGPRIARSSAIASSRRGERLSPSAVIVTVS